MYIFKQYRTFYLYDFSSPRHLILLLWLLLLVHHLLSSLALSSFISLNNISTYNFGSFATLTLTLTALFRSIPLPDWGAYWGTGSPDDFWAIVTVLEKK